MGGTDAYTIMKMSRLCYGSLSPIDKNSPCQKVVYRYWVVVGDHSKLLLAKTYLMIIRYTLYCFWNRN